MDLLDVSKENIQPLKRGRNISTLNTALQAQTDFELHQQLMKEREEFEVLVRSYSGDDPLKPWYDYVQWVEQNFPKHGREGNLKVLLENCLAQFKDCEQYSQDVRFIDLWTRYMSYADNPLEMYKQIHAKGIGTECAIFYQCWAEEYEQANDMKRADQIFIEGIRRNAQPLDELISAHNNFQVRVARSVLGQNPMNNVEFATERTALSTLRAHGRRKNMVDSTRVGLSIKHATPGILRSSSNATLGERRNGNVQLSKIAVLSDENAPFTDAVANPQVKSAISLSKQSANKENMLNPGRWNEGKFKKKSSAPVMGITHAPIISRNPVFQVHVDEDSDVPRTPKTDIMVSNVLKARKHVYEDEKNIPIAIFEPHDLSKVPAYPKSKVYSGGTEFSLEELRAIRYFKREKERKKASNENEMVREKLNPELHHMDLEDVFELNDQQMFLTSECQAHLNGPGKKVHISNEAFKTCKDQLQRDSVEIYTKPEEKMNDKFNQENQPNIQLNEVLVKKEREPIPTPHQGISQKSSFEVFEESKEEMDAKLKTENQPNVKLSMVPKERKLAPTPAQILGEVPFSGCLKVPKLLKDRKGSMTQSEDEISQNAPSLEQRDCDQSLTVNTKAVLNDVKDMWVSSPQVEPKCRGSLFQKLGCQPLPPETEYILPSTTPFRAFKIFSDVSTIEPEKVNTINVHIDQESEEKGLPVQGNWVKRMGLQNERDDLPKHQQQICLNDRTPKSSVLSSDVFDTYMPLKQNLPPVAEMASSISFERDLLKEERLRSSENDLGVIKCQQRLELASGEGVDDLKSNFHVYTDPSANSPENCYEVHKQSIGIPFVPSPGMTPAQLVALVNSEDKENMLMRKPEQRSQHCKSKRSILQPSKDVYFVPLEEQQQQQLAEEEMMQQAPFSDETCCTEAFAHPLVSSTPMFNTQFKYMGEGGKKADAIDNSIALMNLYGNVPNLPEKNLPGFYGSSPPKTFTGITNKDKNDIPELPCSSYGASGLQRSQLSVIFELSERKKSSSTGTTDGSNASKSSGFDMIHKHCSISRHRSSGCNIPTLTEERDLQDDICFLNNGSQLSHEPSPLAFFSDDFRENCWSKIEFPSDKHQLHCEQLATSLDKKINRGSLLFVGSNHYSIFSVSKVKGYEFCTAFDTFSKKLVEIEVKDNTHLWEQYIREEIRLRIEDSSMINHFIVSEKTFIFLNKHVLLYNKCPQKTLKESFEDNQIGVGGRVAEADVLNLAGEILNIVHSLHQCNIVHGSLSLQSFMCMAEKSFSLLLINFEKAVDMTLLPSDTVFDATEKPLYSMMNACRLPPFQIDYIALANIFHYLIFREPIKVHQERGMWCITRRLPENFEENLWKKVFDELLNNSSVSLLHLCCLLEQHCASKVNL